MRKIHYSKGLEVKYLNKNRFSIEELLYDIKRDITLFDQIVCPALNARLDLVKTHFYDSASSELKIHLAEFDYLVDQGLIRDFEYAKNRYLMYEVIKRMSEDQRFIPESAVFIAHALGNQVKKLGKFITLNSSDPDIENKTKWYWQLHNHIDHTLSMAISEVLRFDESIEIIDSVRNEEIVVNVDSARPVSRSNVYQFLLHDLPLPSDETPWQDVLDYKTQKENTRRLALLRNWINKVIKEQYSENELVDEYEALYIDFENSINRQKIKTKRTVLKVLLVGLPELTEDVIKLRFKNIGEKIYKGLFEASSEMTALADTEASAPGRELAYMFFSKEQFKKD